MTKYLINGVDTDYIHVSDRGFQYGDGIFETILCLDAKCQYWDKHMARMESAANKLKLSFPGEDQFSEDVLKLLNNSISKNVIIKLILTRGSGSRGYATQEKAIPLRIASIHDYEVDQSLKDGVSVTVCKQTVSTNKALAGIKHMNRLENVIARNEWHDEFHEGIMLDDNGNVIEGTMSNVFIVKDDVLSTPDLISSGVAGIMREAVLNIANSEGIATQITQISMDDINSADEIFVTNSVIGLWPVTKLDNKDLKRGSVSQLLQKQLQQSCSDNA